MPDTAAPSLPRPDPWLRWLPWALGLLFLLPNYAFFHDNLVYANQVSFRPWAVKLHPHHLGYNALIWLVWTLTGRAISPLFLMVGLGRLAGIASLFSVRRLASELELPPAGQRWLLALWGLSFGVWFHATAGAAYVPAVWCMLEALRSVHAWPAESPSRRQFAVATGWFLAAVLLHQLAVLSVIPALGWLWLEQRAHRSQSLRRLAGIWIGVAAVLYALAFVAVFHTLNPLEGWLWATRYGHEGHWWWWEGVSKLGTGFNAWLATQAGTSLRVLWGTPFGQHLDPVTTEPLAMVWQVAWPKARYFQLAQVLLIPLMLGWCGLAWRWWRAHPEQRRLALWLLCWMLPFRLLTLVFDPENAGFRLYYLLPALALLLLPLTTDPPRPLALALCALGPLALAFTLATNYAYGWNPLSRGLINPRYDEIGQARDLPEGLVLVGAPDDPDWLDQQYLMQFLGRPVEQSAWVTPTNAHPAADSSRPLFVSKWLIDKYLATPAALRPTHIHTLPARPGDPEQWFALADWHPVTGWDRGYYKFVELDPNPAPPD